MRTLYLMAFAAAIGSPLFAGATSRSGFTTLYKFVGSSAGQTPQGLVAGPNGVLYGTTAYGGTYGFGTVFELQPPAAPGGTWTETVIYNFTGENSDGKNPFASPTLGANGSLYGTTTYGGYYGSGAAYELQPPSDPGGAWTEMVLFSFVDTDNGGSGFYPYERVVIGNNGELYGATSGGGIYYFGAIFELAPPAAPGGTWTESVIYSFTGDGREPVGLTMGANGVLYGATAYGGGSGAGTVFELMPPSASGGTWSAIVLYTFSGGADGVAPLQPPVIANNGTLYGTTSGGGSTGAGTVFALTPGQGGIWTKTVLYDFANSGDGKIPDSPLVLRSNAIYGTTATGTGAQNAGGSVFELRKTAGGAWTETVLHDFAGAAGPYGSFVMDKSGAIYGATTSGPGPTGAGMVYKIVP
ncbi:MAG: choice-of-anchor tandem repeat GloVer-containing protein [Bryobacteraceae bacterium]